MYVQMYYAVSVLYTLQLTDEADRTFVSEVFAGCVRYETLIKVCYQYCTYIDRYIVCILTIYCSDCLNNTIILLSEKYCDKLVSNVLIKLNIRFK